MIGQIIIDQLNQIRKFIRLGLVDDGLKLFNAISPQTRAKPVWQNEFGFLQLQQFIKPSEIRFYDIASNPEDQCRSLVLQAIVRNRSRDPLAALALLVRANELTENIKQPEFKLDVLLETARVYAWLGNMAQMLDYLVEVLSRVNTDSLTSYRFLAFCRLADAYAEVERWLSAKTYIGLAEALAKPFAKSVYWLQLQECAARVNLALDQDPGDHLAQLQKNDSILPAYLQFRWQALRIENSLHTHDHSTETHLNQLSSLAVCRVRESFESVAVSVLRAKYDISRGQSRPAIAPLQTARDWFADEDLAVRLIDARILLAKALSADGQTEVAAAELDSARNYCISRNLNVQLEKIETACADLQLTLHPVVETNRVTSDNAWKNRQAYVLLQKLGSGGQGEVYLAHDNARAKNVALKKLKIAPRQSANQLAALEREVRGANAAAAPGMARVLACGQESETVLYIVQEYVPGQSLRKLIEQGKPTLSHLIELAETLNALHRRGVVHGDVKPENIIITPEGSTMLVDFGLASLISKKSENLLGATARYAPPTLANKFHDAAWRDRYAVGLILLECLGAKLPEVRKAKWLDAFTISQDLTTTIRKLPKSTARDLAAKLISPLLSADLSAFASLK